MLVHCGVHVTFVIVCTSVCDVCVHGMFLIPAKLMKLHAAFSSLEDFLCSFVFLPSLSLREPLKLWRMWEQCWW